MASRGRLRVAPLAEEVFEEVAEPSPPSAKSKISRVEVSKVEALESSAGSPSSLKGAMAELIVLLAEFRVTQDMIGLRDLLKSALGLLVARIEVGMKLPR